MMVTELQFIKDNIVKLQISKYLAKVLDRAGFAKVDIQKTPVITRITVYVKNPGRVIGRGGENINKITDEIKKKYHVENPQIIVANVENEWLEPLLVAKYIGYALERGGNVRKVLHSAIKKIIDNGAIGAEITVSGKLAAKNARAKSVTVKVGYVPKVGDVIKLVREAKHTQYPKYGAIGVVVRITPPGTVFPKSEVKKVELPKTIKNADQNL